MRILHVIAEMGPGGAERVILHLAAAADDAGDRVTVLSAGGSWVPRLEKLGARHVTIPRRGDGAPGPVATARAVRREVARERPHVVHTTNVRVTVGTRLGLLALGKRRPPVLTAAQGTSPEEMTAAGRILRRTSDLVVGCAPTVTRDLADAGVPRDRLRTVENAALLDPAPPGAVAECRAALALDDRPLVVGLGRLVEQKNWPLLVEALAGFHDVQVVVAGAGPLHDELTALAEASGAPVRFVGYVDDVAALLASAVGVVSTSDWEGLPLALLEAMSLGLPVIATSVDGNTEALGGAADLVAAGDASAVRAAVERLVDDERRRAELGERSGQVAARHAPSAMATAYRALYEELTTTP